MGNLTSCVGGRSSTSSTGHLNHHENPTAHSSRLTAADKQDGRDGGHANNSRTPKSVVQSVDSYESRMRIDDEVLVERYRHRMTVPVESSRQQSVSASNSRRQSSGRARVTFRAESFDSQASTESERMDFVMQLIDSLPETFLDNVKFGDDGCGDDDELAPRQLLVTALVSRDTDATEESSGGDKRARASAKPSAGKFARQASFDAWDDQLSEEPQQQAKPPTNEETIQIDDLNT